MDTNEAHEEDTDIRMSNFSQIISIIFVTLVIGISIISILFF